MGNHHRNVDRSYVNEILEEGRTNWIYYPLTDTQSRQLRTEFVSIKKDYGELGKSEKTFFSNVQHYSIIGYYKGDILAFRFSDSRTPFICFEYRNIFYRVWLDLIQNCWKNTRKDGYEELIQLRIEFYKVPDYNFYFVTSVSSR